MLEVQGMKIGMKVKVTHLETTDGMLISEKHLLPRKADSVGEVLGWVPGHGGDIWWVKHDVTGEICAYSFTELEEVKNF
jgi:hypothetical protein